jgi:type VI secretion system protein ImpC
MAEGSPEKLSAEAEQFEADEFSKLFEKDYNLKKNFQRDDVAKAVHTLATEALKQAGIVEGAQGVVDTVRELIGELDTKIAAQVNEILHHADFQKLEGSWRGLKFLTDRTETGTDLKIKVMHATKNELRDMFRRHSGNDFDQSPLWKQIYEMGYGVLDGEPFGAIVGDYHFDHGAVDLGILKGMGQIAAAAHAPFIAGADHNLLDLQDWRDLPKKADLASVLDTPPYKDWRAFRETEDARYIGLAMPRFLSRRPYDPRDNPVDEFHFVEETNGTDLAKFCWSNSAFAMAANITRAFKLYGWCSRIRGYDSGGLVEDLPTYTFQAEDGSFVEQCPTEVSIPDRRELELANLGLMPLIYAQNSNKAAFIGAQSLHKPQGYEGATGAEATKNAQLGARLPYIFACARFAHYLKYIQRRNVGSYTSREDLQRDLSGWIANYVANDPGADEITKSRRPLAEAEVKVEDNPENPGYYSATFYLRPHYQLEGVNVSLRLVASMPSQVSG